MNKSSAFAALAAVILMAGFTVACEDTSDPDPTEAFAADLTDGTSTDKDGTEPAAAEENAPAKTPEQAEESAAMKDRRTQLHAADRTAKAPLKAE